MTKHSIVINYIFMVNYFHAGFQIKKKNNTCFINYATTCNIDRTLTYLSLSPIMTTTSGSLLWSGRPSSCSAAGWWSGGLHVNWFRETEVTLHTSVPTEEQKDRLGMKLMPINLLNNNKDNYSHFKIQIQNTIVKNLK